MKTFKEMYVDFQKKERILLPSLESICNLAEQYANNLYITKSKINNRVLSDIKNLLIKYEE